MDIRTKSLRVSNKLFRIVLKIMILWKQKLFKQHTKALLRKHKIDKLHFIKIKNTCLSNDILRE